MTGPLTSVLIVDDDEVDRYILTRLVREAGLTDAIFECSDGQQALAFLSDRRKAQREYPDKFPPILVFLDINMPRMDGFEFLASYGPLRAELEQESVVLLMWTSSVLERDQRRAAAFPFVKGWIQKMPGSADGLLTQIRDATGWTL